MRKILYSPGYGAGFSTWNTDIPEYFCCTYMPIIEAIENGEKLIPEDRMRYNADVTDYHESVQLFVKECQEKFGVTPYLGGVYQLKIFECDDDTKVRIEEYDGCESVQTSSNERYF